MATKKNQKKKEIIHKFSLKKYGALLIVSLLVFGIGYLLGVISMNMVPKKDILEYKKIEKANDSRVTSLMSKLMAGSDCWNVEDYANDHKVDVKNISNDRIYQVVQWGSFYDKGVASISLEDFNSEIKNYFSIGFNFDPDGINQNHSNCNPYVYDDEKQEFTGLKISCQDLCGPNRTLYKITNVEDNGFDLKVTIHVLFGSQAERVAFYSDYERSNYVTDDYDHLDKYYKEGDAYLFTFLRVDEKYLYVSSEKI